MNAETRHAEALQRLLAAPRPPRPWRDGRQLPWNDPAFSRRMLDIHLDPDTDMASRRPDVIRRHVEWLLGQLDGLSPGGDTGWNVLDVGCGPGLYCAELARRGHRAAGFDFAPSPLRWARATAQAEKLACTYLEADLTDLPPDLGERMGAPFDAVTFWYGEFHSFPPDVTAAFMKQLAALLRPGGLFVLEYQPWDLFVQEDSTSWSACERSPFSDRPHVWLEEFAWDEESAAEIHVHWIIDNESGNLDRYVQCHQAWRDADLAALCARCGLVDPAFHPPLTGVDERVEFPVMVTRRASATAAVKERPDLS